jgi:hypothetical protein
MDDTTNTTNTENVYDGTDGPALLSRPVAIFRHGPDASTDPLAAVSVALFGPGCGRLVRVGIKVADDGWHADAICPACGDLVGLTLDRVTFDPDPEPDDDTDDDDGPTDDTAACVACGDAIDYCRGHGPSGDPAGAAILAAHDDDDHAECHPAGCETLAARLRMDDDDAAVYCGRHDMFRPCHWCDPAPADRGAVSLVAAVLVALVAAVVLVVLALLPGPTTAPAPAAITEDSAAWDCWTMGSGWCGPVLVVLVEDGTADVHDSPPAREMGDTLVASALPVTAGAVASLPAPCRGANRADGRGGPGRSGPVASVVVLTENADRAAVIHNGPAGPCVGAIGAVMAP